VHPFIDENGYSPISLWEEKRREVKRSEVK